jgi:hypothetical protein
MAKRKFGDINYSENAANGSVPGDGAAHRAAAALADKADFPTIAALSEMLSTLERVGGQFYVTAFRAEQDNGSFDTLGLAIDYETRDARVIAMDAPDEVAGVSVTDLKEPSVAIESETPDEPEACEICGRLDPEERPDEAPCQCQVEADADAEDREPAPALSE